MIALSQGFVVNSALFGVDDPKGYLERVSALLGWAGSAASST